MNKCRKISFYISSAGVSGDPYKLLYGVDHELEFKCCELFNENSIWSLKRAKKKIIKKIKALEPEYIYRDVA